MAFANLKKTDMILINGEARGHSEPHGKFTVKGYLKGYFNARTFVNVVQHLRDFERFHMNKRDLARWTLTRRSYFTCRRRNSS
jgi:hypothetical protein